MTEFKLDTTGFARKMVEDVLGAEPHDTYWSDLSPFTQGYIEALFAALPYPYAVQPLNEPHGKGSGWYPCADDAPGVLFYPERVSDPDDAWAREGERTRAKAQAECDRLNAGRFSDLAPETLAAIIRDCAAYQAFDSRWTPRAQRSVFEDPKGRGRSFWASRQDGFRGLTFTGSTYAERFPPLTVQLGDDGKVRFAA